MEWPPPHLPSVPLPQLWRTLVKVIFKKRVLLVVYSLFTFTWNVFLHCRLFHSFIWCSPPPHPGCGKLSELFGQRCQWHSKAKIIDFASLSAASLMLEDFQETLFLVFLPPISAATLISSCKTSAEFTTLWNTKKACNPVTRAAARLLRSWEKTCSTNPTVTTRALCYLTVCGSHLIYSLFEMFLLNVW